MHDEIPLFRGGQGTTDDEIEGRGQMALAAYIVVACAIVIFGFFALVIFR